MDEDNPAQVGRRIRKLRRRLGLSQRGVAEPVITSSYLSLIESGRRVPSPEILAHIAARLSVDPEELLTGRPPGLEVTLEMELHEARELAHKGGLEAAEAKATQVLKNAERSRLGRLRAKALTRLGAIVWDRSGP